MRQPSRQLKLMVLAASIFCISVIAGCSSKRLQPYETQMTESRMALETLLPPRQKMVAAVYRFPDETGQHQETRSGNPHYSKAVTQGAAALLIDSLQKAGDGGWFRVVERNRLENVTIERSIIRDMRQGATDPQGNPLPPPKPLLYAGVIFEGGIIGYDTNYVTGGAGARFLGIGASTEYREDLVTISLRAVSSQTGEIWKNIVVSKRIYSVLVRGDVFRYVGSKDILEGEAGFTQNEPRLIALQHAIDEAVFRMIMEGAGKGLWSFADEAAGKTALVSYFKKVEGRQLASTKTEFLE